MIATIHEVAGILMMFIMAAYGIANITEPDKALPYMGFAVILSFLINQRRRD